MPTTSSKVYDGVFAVSSTATVKAIVVKDEYITSAMASSTITVNGTDVSLKDNIALGKNVKVSSSENPSVDGSKIVDNDGITQLIRLHLTGKLHMLRNTRFRFQKMETTGQQYMKTTMAKVEKKALYLMQLNVDM